MPFYVRLEHPQILVSVAGAEKSWTQPLDNGQGCMYILLYLYVTNKFVERSTKCCGHMAEISQEVLRGTSIWDGP